MSEIIKRLQLIIHSGKYLGGIILTDGEVQI